MSSPEDLPASEGPPPRRPLDRLAGIRAHSGVPLPVEVEQVDEQVEVELAERAAEHVDERAAERVDAELVQGQSAAGTPSITKYTLIHMCARQGKRREGGYPYLTEGHLLADIETQ